MSKEIAQYSSSQVLEIRKNLYRHTMETRTLQDELSDRLELRAGMSLLDAGCGNGAVLLDMLARVPGTTGVGFDNSEGMIAEATAATETTGAPARFFIDDVEQPAITETFDRLLVKHVLHLSPHPREVMNRLLTLLKPGGRCVIALHTSTDLPKLKSWNRWFTETTGVVYTAGRDKFMLEENGNFLADVSGTIEKDHFKSTIRLTDPKPFVEYVDTTRSRWEPAPTDEQWSTLLQHVRSEITDEIARNGHFDEQQTVGIIVIDAPK